MGNGKRTLGANLYSRDINDLEYSPMEAAKIVEVHRDTLMRWIRLKKIPDVGRKPNGYRFFTLDDIDNLLNYKNHGSKKDNLSL